jgi:hypothetical protein
MFAFAFAGMSTVLHQLEQEEKHHHEDGTHLCAPDHHHHCSLCDVVIYPSLASTVSSETTTPIFNNEYSVTTQSALLNTVFHSVQGRAPPTV